MRILVRFAIMKKKSLYVLLLLVTVGGTSEALQNSGTAWVEPEIIRSANGVLEVVLDMHRAQNMLAGREISTLTYNGTIPGPTLRVKPGDLLKIRLVNNMTLPITAPERILLTNLHTHGLQVSPIGNGDNPFLEIKPGEYIDLQIQVPKNQPPGLFWYHPHRHVTTARQGWNGMAGAIIVEGGIDELPEIKAAKERLMIVNEMWLDEYGQVPFGIIIPIAGFVPFSVMPAVPTSLNLPINGINEPTIDIRPGEVQRWRFLNACPHRTVVLKLDGHTLYQIAQDGIHFTRLIPQDTLLVEPGNRVEFLVKGGPSGTYKLRALQHDQGHPGGPRPERLLGTVVTSGAPADGKIPLSLLPSPEPDIRNAAVSAQRIVRFKGGIITAPVIFYLDGQTFDPQRIDNTVTAGTVEEWTLINEDIFQHPFHIHVNPFQVIEINGEPSGYPEDVWWDTFALPSFGSVKIRTYFREDIPGKTVYHCHILPHEDNGMMSAFNIALPSGLTPSIPLVGPFATGSIPESPQPQFTRLLDRPYVFTHTSNGTTAKVRVGSLVQIQLPGDPTKWELREIDSPRVVPVGSSIIPSAKRIPGSDSIYQFDFRVDGPGLTTITLVATPPLSWMKANPFKLTILSRGEEGDPDRTGERSRLR